MTTGIEWVRRVALGNPWWACYSRDYAAKTGHLTMLQHGAYFTLLNTYYISGGPLPEKTDSLVRICRAQSTEEIEAISFVLTSFFFLRSDGWHNKRADAEIKEMKRISMLRRNARLGKRKTIDTTNDNQLYRQSHTHTHIEPKSKAYAHSRIALPALVEVIAYCQERKNQVDPQQWFNYYTANGWKVGRNAMKDWRAAVRTWERNGYSDGVKAQQSLLGISEPYPKCKTCKGTGKRVHFLNGEQPCHCTDGAWKDA